MPTAHLITPEGYNLRVCCNRRRCCCCRSLHVDRSPLQCVRDMSQAVEQEAVCLAVCASSLTDLNALGSLAARCPSAWRQLILVARHRNYFCCRCRHYRRVHRRCPVQPMSPSARRLTREVSQPIIDGVLVPKRTCG
jgi:hypothetical protein